MLLHCTNCSKPFIRKYPDKKTKNYFCGHSCSAEYNNLAKPKNKRYCINCCVEIQRNKQTGWYGNTKQKYCSVKCQQDYQYKEYIARWKEGKETGVVSKYFISNPIKRYIRNKYNNKCCKCGWNEINLKTNIVPVQVNHIDGNFKNNIEDNLELLCPNCHSLTPTYGALNKGNGRTERYK